MINRLFRQGSWLGAMLLAAAITLEHGPRCPSRYEQMCSYLEHISSVQAAGLVAP